MAKSIFTTAEVDEYLEDVIDQSSVYSYLSSSSTTTISVAETWYAVQGSFVNDFTNFELDTDKIKYIGDNDYKFEIDWCAKIAHSVVSSTVNVTISINGIPIETAKMGTFAKTAGEPVSFSGSEVVTLTKDDTIQIVVQSDKAGTVTFGNFVTSLNKFVIKRQ